MELELGLKFTRISDDFTSDFQIAKDRAGTLFLSRETDTMFVLTAHLKGYKRGNIKIDINKDGSLISISGEKQIKETVMVGWKVYKKDAEIKGFKKVFRIPNGVILDKIKAVFNEDESTLSITMPKKVKGIQGTEIEEVKEEHGLVKEGSGNLQIADDQQSLEKGEKLKAKVIEDRVDDSKDEEERDVENRRKVDEIEEMIENKEDQEVDNENDVVENEENKVDQEVGNENNVVKDEENKVDQEVGNENNVVENEENKVDQEVGNENNVVKDEENKVDQEVGNENNVVENEERLVQEKDEWEEGGEKGGGNKCKMCLPIIAGSTLLLSFVVFVIQIIRSKNRNSTRRD